ncbi:hypothetical protein, partial [Mariniluteicoccus endophyticus]
MKTISRVASALCAAASIMSLHVGVAMAAPSATPTPSPSVSPSSSRTPSASPSSSPSVSPPVSPSVSPSVSVSSSVAVSPSRVASAQASSVSVIDARWVGLGGAGSPLGSPVSGEFCGLRDGGCGQRFERGYIYWSQASGAHP